MHFHVIDSLAIYFTNFKDEFNELPILWHQSLLSFVQRYKEDMTIEQKEALIDLVSIKNHYAISPEVVRELTETKCRTVNMSN